MFKNLSIKFKMTISFVILSLSLIFAYILIAKSTFEDDKISYIFDSQQQQANTIASQIESRVNRIVLDSRSILSGFDFKKNQLNLLAQNLFNEQQDILAFQIIDSEKNQIFIK